MKLIKICTISAGLLLSFGGLLNSSILSIKNDRDVILSENIEAMSQDGENPRKFEAVICYNDSASMGTVSILFNSAPLIRRKLPLTEHMVDV